MIISQSIFTTLFLSGRFTDRQLLFAAIGSFKKKHRDEYTSAGSYARKMYSPEHYVANDPGADVTIPRIRFKDGHGHHRHATHAITADILIPCSSSTIRLVLTVMHAYLHRDCTVAKLCERFNIAHSTFYSRKRLEAEVVRTRQALAEYLPERWADGLRDDILRGLPAPCNIAFLPGYHVKMRPGLGFLHRIIVS